MAIGRLDVNSEGLLLLTTDGKVSEEIRSKKVEKEYYVQVDGCITQKDIKYFKKGLIIGFKGKKYTTKPCKASLILFQTLKIEHKKLEMIDMDQQVGFLLL